MAVRHLWNLSEPLRKRATRSSESALAGDRHVHHRGIDSGCTSHIARGYERINGQVRNNMLVDVASRRRDRALYSSELLVRYFSALFRVDFFRRTTRQSVNNRAPKNALSRQVPRDATRSMVRTFCVACVLPQCALFV